MGARDLPDSPTRPHDSSWMQSNRLTDHFFQEVTGFMVGRDAEQSGIIRSGAKL